MVGTSRKSFLGKIARSHDGSVAPVNERLEASLATATWAMLAGAAMVRVHDVAQTVQAATLVGSVRLEAVESARSDTGFGKYGVNTLPNADIESQNAEIESRGGGQVHPAVRR